MAFAVYASDTKTRRDEREERRVTQEEREHAKNIPENYRKLLFDDEETTGVVKAQYTQSARPAQPVATATIERTLSPAREAVSPAQQSVEQPVRPVHISAQSTAVAHDLTTNTARRIADYVAYEPNDHRPALFDNIEYKNCEIVQKPQASAATITAPVAPVAPAPAPVYVPDEEDALPTQRTLETLRRASAMQAPEVSENVSLLSMISTKAKVAICAIAVAIVAVIALICINTGILSAANAEILNKEARLNELQQTYTQMQEEIDYLMSDEYIDGWAQEHGMVRGN